MIQTQSVTELYSAQFERLKSTLLSGPSWLRQARDEAMALFDKHGIPTTRIEDWRYTNLAPLSESPFLPAEQPGTIDPKDYEQIVTGADALRMVFVDGFFAAEHSCLDRLPVGLDVLPLSQALGGEGALSVEPHLGSCAIVADRPLTALNTAFAHDGVVIRVHQDAQIELPIEIVHLTTGSAEPRVVFPRTLIVAERHSKVTVLEIFAGQSGAKYWTNAVTEIEAAEGAFVDHYKIQRENDQAFHTAHFAIRQDRSSNITGHIFNFGGLLARTDTTAVLDGEGGTCTIKGLNMLRDKQHVDNHLWIEHAKPHCDSREYFKGIYDDYARGVFSGLIKVHEGAQKTDAKQTNMSLLLSDHALADSKPQLEIYADDVKCTHGATIGQIDDDAIFYLRSRGIEEQAARSMLVYSFAGETINEVEVEALRRQLQGLLLERLPQGHMLQGAI